MRLTFSLIYGFSFLLCASLSFAQSTSPSAARSAARELFEQARTLLQKDEVEKACRTFEESQRLEPALGTLLNLALCRERQGKTATAYLDYEDLIAGAAREADEERRRIAEERMRELEPRLSRVSLQAPADAPVQVWIALDGARFGTAALAAAIPIDPGQHLVAFGAPGYRTGSFRFELRGEGVKRTIQLPRLDPVQKVPSTAREPTHSVRSWALSGSAGVAAASLAACAYFGVDAALEWNERDDLCSQRGCDPRASSAGDRARTSARLANVACGVSILATGLGAYLWLSAPKASTEVARVRPPSRVRVQGAIDPSSASVSLVGRF